MRSNALTIVCALVGGLVGGEAFGLLNREPLVGWAEALVGWQ